MQSSFASLGLERHRNSFAALGARPLTRHPPANTMGAWTLLITS